MKDEMERKRIKFYMEGREGMEGYVEGHISKEDFAHCHIGPSNSLLLLGFNRALGLLPILYSSHNLIF
eukprot:scaffold2117_cov82-Skeletonema_dohrnii-CCMP3373.AAC.2